MICNLKAQFIVKCPTAVLLITIIYQINYVRQGNERAMIGAKPGRLYDRL